MEVQEVLRRDTAAMVIRSNTKRYKNIIEVLKRNGFDILNDNTITQITDKNGVDRQNRLKLFIYFGEPLGESGYTIRDSKQFTAKVTEEEYERIQDELMYIDDEIWETYMLMKNNNFLDIDRSTGIILG